MEGSGQHRISKHPRKEQEKVKARVAAREFLSNGR